MKTLQAWVARDENGRIFLYLAPPWKSQIEWTPYICFNLVELSRESFPEVKWDDEEPTEVRITLKRNQHGKNYDNNERT